jgi:hypothetical protein
VTELASPSMAIEPPGERHEERGLFITY